MTGRNVFIILAVAASLVGRIDGGRCKTKQPSKKRLAEEYDRLRTTRMRTLADEPRLKFKVAFHVIHKKDGTGKLSERDLRSQVDVLNNAFAGKTSKQGIDSMISFDFHSVEYIISNKWFGQGCDTHDGAFKKNHNKDLTKVINIYTCSGSGSLGWATIPSDYQETSHQHAIVVAWDTLPQMGKGQYDEGDTAVHEVGHFLGLLHTFSNNQCSEGSGDGVSDTPLQRSATDGCPAKRDSCPKSAGLDPTDNYMDYSDDACMNRFTRGQIDKMRRSIKTYKPQLVANSHEDDDGGTAGPTPSPVPTSVENKPTTSTSATTSTQAMLTQSTTVKPVTQCKQSQWLCQSGNQCIKAKWKCDGITDCRDLSDEADTLCQPNLQVPTTSEPISCEQGKWSCANGQKCIKSKWRCDGIKDCKDGSDESDDQCEEPEPHVATTVEPAPCSSKQWQCDNGQCIKGKYHCDGVKDCKDNSDEKWNCWWKNPFRKGGNKKRRRRRRRQQ